MRWMMTRSLRGINLGVQEEANSGDEIEGLQEQ